MIRRKILKVKTKGSRATGDLRPIFSDETPQGINYVVYDYNETEGSCIVEIWSSDHEALAPQERYDHGKWNKIINHPSVIETLPSYSKSPTILGTIAAMLSPRVLDEKKKVVKDTTTGKEYPYLRKSKETKKATATSLEHETIILDEG